MAGGRAMTHLVTSYSAYTVCHVTCATNRIRRSPLLAAIFVSTKPFTPHKTQPQQTSMCFQLSILSSSIETWCVLGRIASATSSAECGLLLKTKQQRGLFVSVSDAYCYILPYSRFFSVCPSADCELL